MLSRNKAYTSSVVLSVFTMSILLRDLLPTSKLMQRDLTPKTWLIKSINSSFAAPSLFGGRRMVVICKDKWLLAYKIGIIWWSNHHLLRWQLVVVLLLMMLYSYIPWRCSDGNTNGFVVDAHYVGLFCPRFCPNHQSNWRGTVGNDRDALGNHRWHDLRSGRLPVEVHCKQLMNSSGTKSHTS